MHADLATPTDQSLRRPLLVRTVRGRYAFLQRREPATYVAADVILHANAPVNNLYQPVSDARLQLHPYQRVRQAVALSFDLDVMVDVRNHRLELKYSPCPSGNTGAPAGFIRRSGVQSRSLSH